MGRKDKVGLAVIAGAAAAAGAAYLAWAWRKVSKAEIERLAALLDWAPGRVFADVGAGGGAKAIEAARRVGATGHVFATDVEAKKVEKLRRKVMKKGLSNVTPVQSDQNDVRLPESCCDAMLLRVSYHHFTNPESIDASLCRALRPNGLLAVIDFAPRRWLTLVSPVKGAPPDRGGHGVPRDVLTREMTAAGFNVEKEIPDWLPGGIYCVVFRKPEA